MKKVTENTRPTGAPTTTTEAESRDNTQYCLSYCLTLSETSRGIFSRMDRNTPSNELILRGFC